MADIAKWMRSVDEQLRKLATAARANKTDVRGGFTRWYSSVGNHVVRIGEFTSDDVAVSVNADGDEEIELYLGTTSGAPDLYAAGPEKLVGRAALRILNGIWHAPLIACAWQHDPLTAFDASGYAVVSSGTYTRCWTALLPITSGAIRGSVIVGRTGTAVVDARIQIRDFGAGGSPVTLYEEAGISGTVFLSGWPWSVPESVVSPSGDPIGALALLELEVRVASGSGNAVVAPDAPLVNWAV